MSSGVWAFFDSSFFAALFAAAVAVFLVYFPRVRLQYTVKHSFMHILKPHPSKENPNPNGRPIFVLSVIVQNTGQKPAEKVEIVLGKMPDSYQLWPPRENSAMISATSHYVISVPSIGPKEFVFLEVLSVDFQDQLLNVRSVDGAAQLVETRPQIVFSAVWIGSLWALILIGFVVSLDFIFEMLGRLYVLASA